MGRTIHSLLNGFEVVIFNNEDDFNKKDLSSCDVAIEFSTPESVVKNIKRCFKANVPVVVGTTAWYNQFEEVKTACEAYNGALVYATNFSIGVNLFFELNKKAVLLLKNFEEYKCSITEIHHLQKLDAPSGTAISLAEDILENNDSLNNWSLTESKAEDLLIINSKREKDVKGTHIIKYKSIVDEIELKHTAYSRDGFAKGSILAAKWIIDKKGIFSFREILSSLM